MIQSKQWRARLIALKNLIALGMLGLMLSANSLQAQTLRWFGSFGNTQPGSTAYDVSADGSVVVGVIYSELYGQRIPHAFRWTASTGIRDLGQGLTAYGVSWDGAVVVGGDGAAFRWTQAGGMQWLSEGYGAAYDVSADGSVVVGQAGGAFRWTPTEGLQHLGTLGGRSSFARGVSADGSVVVGYADNASGLPRAFRWTASGGMQDLGVLPDGTYSQAWGISADGLVIVGLAQNASGYYHAFRWTASGGMQDLGTLGGLRSWAYGASRDGSTVVGMAERSDGAMRAFRWTTTRGMEDLNEIYACLVAGGSYLRAAYAISPNGRYIVGEGYNAATRRFEGFLLDTGRCHVEGDVNGDGVVDDADLLIVLFNFGQRCD